MYVYFFSERKKAVCDGKEMEAQFYAANRTNAAELFPKNV
jgi:hypothetical protein